MDRIDETKQGTYSLEDYYGWPEGQRIELLDGVIYEMPTPDSIHQALVGSVFCALRKHVESSCRAYFTLMGPVDVRLNGDNRTMVQPDVIVVCDRKKVTGKRVEGAPDLVIEVAAQETKKRDFIIKLEKYALSGVREYWIVEPEQKRVFTYDFQREGMLPSLHSFEEAVPVSIFDGACAVDFAEIYRENEFLFRLGDPSA